MDCYFIGGTPCNCDRITLPGWLRVSNQTAEIISLILASSSTWLKNQEWKTFQMSQCFKLKKRKKCLFVIPRKGSFKMRLHILPVIDNYLSRNLQLSHGSTNHAEIYISPSTCNRNIFKADAREYKNHKEKKRHQILSLIAYPPSNKNSLVHTSCLHRSAILKFRLCCKCATKVRLAPSFDFLKLLRPVSHLRSVSHLRLCCLEMFGL